MSQPDRQSLADALAQGRALSRSGDDEAAIPYFRVLADRHPDDARVWAEHAYACDRAGREEEALGSYRRALALDLPEEYLPGHFVGFGSTLRNVGLYGEAVEVLAEAVERYPDYAPLRVFLAFAQHSNAEPGRALATLLDLILASPGVDLARYERSIRYYTDEVRG